MVKRVDCMIVGQGIAGTCVAWELARRGWSIKVWVDPETASSSSVAAGLITPLSGLRLALSWRYRELMPIAWERYEQMQRALGISIIERRDALRIFCDQEERQQWQKRRDNPETRAFAGRAFPAGEVVAGEDAPPLVMPFGGALIKGGGRVRLSPLLEAMRDALRRDDAWESFRVDPPAVERKGEMWQIGDYKSPRVVFCEGYRAEQNPLWAGLVFRNARGDLLQLRSEVALQHHLMSRGLFAAYLGPKHYCLGGNYDWRAPLTSDPGSPGAGSQPRLDPKAAQELHRRFEALSRCGAELLGHQAGVRPIVQGRVPVVGEHPEQPGLFIVNGLASKGTLWAPAMALRLRQIFDGQADPDPEIDVRSRMRSPKR